MYTIYNEKISEKVQSYYIPKKNAAAVWATGLPSIYPIRIPAVKRFGENERSVVGSEVFPCFAAAGSRMGAWVSSMFLIVAITNKTSQTHIAFFS